MVDGEAVLLGGDGVSDSGADTIESSTTRRSFTLSSVALELTPSNETPRGTAGETFPILGI